jgi:hypothetical protein
VADSPWTGGGVQEGEGGSAKEDLRRETGDCSAAEIVGAVREGDGEARCFEGERASD